MTETQPHLAPANAAQAEERSQRLPRINYSFAHKRCYATAATLIGVIGEYKDGKKKKYSAHPVALNKSDQTKLDS